MSLILSSTTEAPGSVSSRLSAPLLGTTSRGIDSAVGRGRHRSLPSPLIAYYISVTPLPRSSELLLHSSIGPHGDDLAGS